VRIGCAPRAAPRTQHGRRRPVACVGSNCGLRLSRAPQARVGLNREQAQSV
jgi:hypothetical protein